MFARRCSSFLGLLFYCGVLQAEVKDGTGILVQVAEKKNQGLDPREYAEKITKSRFDEGTKKLYKLELADCRKSLDSKDSILRSGASSESAFEIRKSLSGSFIGGDRLKLELLASRSKEGAYDLVMKCKGCWVGLNGDEEEDFDAEVSLKDVDPFQHKFRSDETPFDECSLPDPDRSLGEMCRNLAVALFRCCHDKNHQVLSKSENCQSDPKNSEQKHRTSNLGSGGKQSRQK